MVTKGSTGLPLMFFKSLTATASTGEAVKAQTGQPTSRASYGLQFGRLVILKFSSVERGWTFLTAVKINDISSKCVLTEKLKTVYAARPQPTPKDLLRFGLIFTKPSGNINNILRNITSHTIPTILPGSI